MGRAVSGFDDVIERWANDEQFRDDFRADPEAALRDSGIELTDEEWEAVRTTDHLRDGRRPAAGAHREGGLEARQHVLPEQLHRLQDAVGRQVPHLVQGDQLVDPLVAKA